MVNFAALSISHNRYLIKLYNHFLLGIFYIVAIKIALKPFFIIIRMLNNIDNYIDDFMYLLYKNTIFTLSQHPYPISISIK